jgi:hypothetical protein
MAEGAEWQGITAELASVERTSGEMLTIKFKYTNAGSAKVEIARLGRFSQDNVLEHVYYVDTGACRARQGRSPSAGDEGNEGGGQNRTVR